MLHLDLERHFKTERENFCNCSFKIKILALFFITLRFLFSKWTVKEGWDNPNMFTIPKLCSRGRETSQLQEVGRGLRLPADENGNRVSSEGFQLNYIGDFTEADFTQPFVDQINGEISHLSVITNFNFL